MSTSQNMNAAVRRSAEGRVCVVDENFLEVLRYSGVLQALGGIEAMSGGVFTVLCGFHAALG